MNGGMTNFMPARFAAAYAQNFDGQGNNDGVAECSPKTDGTIHKSGPYALYVGATNADRIKRQSGTARAWFLRSPDPSSANGVRSVNSGGSLNYSIAYYPNGVVAGLCFT